MFEDDEMFDFENNEIKGIKVDDCEMYDDILDKISEIDGKDESAFTVMPYTDVDKDKARKFLENKLDKEKVEKFLKAI